VGQQRTVDGEIVVSDPRAIRALAHPARVAVLEKLFGGAVLTATECARVAGLTPSAMSYHLRALERFGLVGRADATGDGRERPWRALGTGMRISAESTLAEQLLFGRMTDQLLAETEAARAHRHAHGPDNDRPSAFLMSGLRLTPAEARALTDAVTDLLEPYSARTAGPEGALEYHGYWVVAPALPPGAPPAGGADIAEDDATDDDATDDDATDDDGTDDDAGQA
jgi:DNA-binding transcriptional ArsR family regulator